MPQLKDRGQLLCKPGKVGHGLGAMKHSLQVDPESAPSHPGVGR